MCLGNFSYGLIFDVVSGKTQKARQFGDDVKYNVFALLVFASFLKGVLINGPTVLV